MRPRLIHSEPAPSSAPRLLHRDADLVVVDKPAGWLTHPDGTAAGPHARPDVLTWLGGGLGVHQRLDVDTSGVLAFSASPAGAARLQGALADRRAKKTYLAVVEGTPPAAEGRLTGAVPEAPGLPAETAWRVRRAGPGWTLVEAHPLTGRTHQIRAHLAQAGCPVRADARYGDPLDLRAPRLLLHCALLDLGDGARFEAEAPPELARYLGAPPEATRAGLAADADTTCHRLLDGAADGCPGWAVDRYGDWLWVQHDAGTPLRPLPPSRGVYTVRAERDRSRGGQPAPALTAGEPAPQPLEVREHGVRYRVRLGEHLSTGLFLDQRPQRAWLARHAEGLRVLNTFAHAGGFSVAAAVGGARTVSVDLSRAWLDRIPEQLAANGVDPAGHDAIFGDVFDWLGRLARRGERFELVILDPPSTSVGSKKRRWSAARDYADLVRLAAPLVAPGGRLWTATNHRQLTPARFARQVRGGLPEGAFLERVCAPPIDFPCDDAPAPVKTFVWRLP